jgi:Protein of unknown function (DUF3800)
VILSRLVHILAPGASDLVAFVEAYFDESGSHAGSSVLCVAGYLFEKDKCVQLDIEWQAVLERYDLPFFRMSACAGGGDPFDKLTMEDRIAAETAMIEIIKRHAIKGSVVATQETVYNEYMTGADVFGSAYSWCCFMCLIGVAAWAEKTKFKGDVAYFFEAGHASQKQTNELMNHIATLPSMRRDFHYVSHAFVNKAKVRPVQAADILAWQGAKKMKEELAGNYRVRADLASLLNGPPTDLYFGYRQAFSDHRKLLAAFPDDILASMMRRDKF